MQYLSDTRDSMANEKQKLNLFTSHNQVKKSLGGESGFGDAKVRDANFRQQHGQLNSRQGSLRHVQPVWLHSILHTRSHHCS
ncbi:hypothetical protein J6590_072844 [Homalodisca vitripennis]|nr:hypothetical protein J6590_072844 [Homalodisca vitripennis]